jgi:hypothetical protein
VPVGIPRAQPSWNTIGRESYLMLGSGNTLGGSTMTLGGGLGSGTMGTMGTLGTLGAGFGSGYGGSASLEALTPRGLAGQQHGSGGALASPDSPTSRWAKHAGAALHAAPPPSGGGGGGDDAPAADANGRNG